MKLAVLISTLFLSSLALAETTPGYVNIPLKKDEKTTAEIARVLKSVSLYGSTFLPEVHCNVQTVENPNQLEVFTVQGQETTVVLCPGAFDGEDNIVSIFNKSQAPLIVKVKPPLGASRISDLQIKEQLAKADARPAPAAAETQDYYKIPASEFDSCLRSAKKQPPGHYVGESFSKATTNRGMFEAMTLYACVSGDRVLFNPQNRVQLVYSSVKMSWLNAACANKKTIDIPDVVPQPQASHVMVVKCALLSALVNPVAK